MMNRIGVDFEPLIAVDNRKFIHITRPGPYWYFIEYRPSWYFIEYRTLTSVPAVATPPREWAYCCGGAAGHYTVGKSSCAPVGLQFSSFAVHAACQQLSCFNNGNQVKLLGSPERNERNLQVHPYVYHLASSAAELPNPLSKRS